MPARTEVCAQPASSCLPFTRNVHDLTPREGPAYGIWWVPGKRVFFSTYADGWPLSNKVPQMPRGTAHDWMVVQPGPGPVHSPCSPRPLELFHSERVSGQGHWHLRQNQTPLTVSSVAKNIPQPSQEQGACQGGRGNLSGAAFCGVLLGEDPSPQSWP